MTFRTLCCAVAVLSLNAMQEPLTPAVDHHQHLFTSVLDPITHDQAVTASDLLPRLDQAGIRRAALFSIAYGFGNPNRPPVADEYEKVKAENDRVSREVARYPDRLRGFCGVDPLKDYAITEIARCSKDPQMRFGLKMHFGNSDVQLDNPEHIAKL